MDDGNRRIALDRGIEGVKRHDRAKTVSKSDMRLGLQGLAAENQGMMAQQPFIQRVADPGGQIGVEVDALDGGSNGLGEGLELKLSHRVSPSFMRARIFYIS